MRAARALLVWAAAGFARFAAAVQMSVVSDSDSDIVAVDDGRGTETFQKTNGLSYLTEREIHQCMQKVAASVDALLDETSENKGLVDKVVSNYLGEETAEKVSLRRVIHSVKRCSKGGGMMENEYYQIMNYVRQHAPLDLLVWGLGFDSVVLDKLNRQAGGKTLFLEPSQAWVQALQKTQEGKTLNVVHYDESLLGTTAGSYVEFQNSPHRANSIPELRERPCFDMILVDSPEGRFGNTTGRAVPLFTAKADVERCMTEGKYAARKEVTVWVHDCVRPLEEKLSKAFLGTERLVSQTGPKKLRKFVFKESKKA